MERLGLHVITASKITYIGIVQTPQVITHCPPLSLVQHLHTSLVRGLPTNQPDFKGRGCGIWWEEGGDNGRHSIIWIINQGQAYYVTLSVVPVYCP